MRSMKAMWLILVRASIRPIDEICRSVLFRIFGHSALDGYSVIDQEFFERVFGCLLGKVFGF